jgi:hypothetical protein
MKYNMINKTIDDEPMCMCWRACDCGYIAYPTYCKYER